MSESNKKNTHGAREWAEKSVNCCTGCEHDCIYCYARGMAERFKRVQPDQWQYCQVRKHDVEKDYGKYDGQVMFPSSHDIMPVNLAACLIVLVKLLVAGNRVLIVSKPHLECIQRICEELASYREQILFRFTIGAKDDAIISVFEPGAPTYTERKACLVYAHENGFKTSISVEPMLDSANIDALINDLLPYVTDAIWVGKMNYIGRLYNQYPHLKPEIQAVEAGQTDGRIQQIYGRWQNHPQIKWKESIKKVVNLPLVTKAGLDI